MSNNALTALVGAIMAALLIAAPASAQAQGDAKAPLKTQQDKVSYSIGLSVGRNLKSQEIDVTPEKFILGLRDALQGEGQILSEEEVRQVMFAFQMERRAKAMEAQTRAAEANKKAGEAFLAANKKQQGVTTTKSGLQYRIEKAGTGAQPKAESVVTTHYRGTLIDGTEFDSSYKRGQPARFPVNGVIPGWTEVLQLMKVGGKWTVWVPSTLAYGEQGAGQQIGPHSTLVFEIELIEIN